jgi:hypothetical protein
MILFAPNTANGMKATPTPALNLSIEPQPTARGFSMSARKVLRAVLYARYSTDKQAESSIGGSVSGVRAHCRAARP